MSLKIFVNDLSTLHISCDYADFKIYHSTNLISDILNFVLCPLPLACSVSQQRITSVAVNVTGEWLAFGCSSLGQLLVWEWQSESYVLKQQGHYYDMNCLAYSPDGQLIATGGDDGKVN